MRILFFSHINLLSSSEYFGGNWIKSLLTHLKDEPGIKLGVCFVSKEDKRKFIKDDITYYNINYTPFLLKKVFHKINHHFYEPSGEKYLNVINDFQPDIIQVFGFESNFGITKYDIDIPVVYHIQGLLNICLNSWFPNGINLFDTLINSNLKAFLFGNGFYHQYYYMKKWAQREKYLIAKNVHFIVRNNWTENYIKLLNQTANTYYVNEVIREVFFLNQWKYPVNQGNHFNFVTVFNGEIYKGWDNILKVAQILKTHTNISYEWNIIGINHENHNRKLFENKYRCTYKSLDVNFIGTMNEEQIVAKLLTSHLYLHVSHVDNSPNSVIEAMIMGMPIIGTNVGGCAELLNYGELGALVNDNDPYMYANTIVNMISDKCKLNSLSSLVRQKSLDKYNPSTITINLIDIYKSILGNSF